MHPNQFLSNVWVVFVLLGGILLTACAGPLPTLPPAPQASPVTSTPSDHPSDNVNSKLTPEQQAILAQLPNRGAAPELNNQTWLNSTPLKLADLRDKVVLIKFWTLG